MKNKGLGKSFAKVLGKSFTFVLSVFLVFSCVPLPAYAQNENTNNHAPASGEPASDMPVSGDSAGDTPMSSFSNNATALDSVSDATDASLDNLAEGISYLDLDSLYEKIPEATTGESLEVVETSKIPELPKQSS